MLTTIALAHGIGPKSIAAALGTAVSLTIAVGLGLLAIVVAHLTGFNDEAVATQVPGTLVGSIGLIAAVPITTALAAVLAHSVPAQALPDSHGHAH